MQDVIQRIREAHKREMEAANKRAESLNAEEEKLCEIAMRPQATNEELHQRQEELIELLRIREGQMKDLRGMVSSAHGPAPGAAEATIAVHQRAVLSRPEQMHHEVPKTGLQSEHDKESQASSLVTSGEEMAGETVREGGRDLTDSRPES